MHVQATSSGGLHYSEQMRMSYAQPAPSTACWRKQPGRSFLRGHVTATCPQVPRRANATEGTAVQHEGRGSTRLVLEPTGVPLARRRERENDGAAKAAWRDASRKHGR